ncbi:MAG: tetraacyldisaccharide 4'-kinase [Melioribacteraceae bacterium]|nr:tetraacyldisaccharide 4'-kinase [Melioribacteraceae bacterium]
MLNIIKILLAPTVIIYYSVIGIRNWLFDRGIFVSKKIDTKIISIGNLTLGGSGKTPAVVMVVNLLKSMNKSVGVLSRGYGRSTKGYKLINNGSGERMPADKCGDEMYLVTDECNVPGAVSERRVKGAERFIKDVNKIDVIVLDDAFQHRWIYRDLDIVMIDQRFLLKNSVLHHNLLPLGVMREPFSSLKRADIIIINRKFSEGKELPAKMKSYMKDKLVLEGHYEVEGIYDVKTHHGYSIEDFVGQKSLVVCGIARPYSFLRILEEYSIDIKNKLLFTDHKNYTLKEVQNIRRKFYNTNSFSVLTTQKDAVKLTNYSRELDDIDIYYLKIGLKLNNEEEFKSELEKVFNN